MLCRGNTVISRLLAGQSRIARTEGLPEHQPPLPLAKFQARWDCLDKAEDDCVFLYHGTNCYRRWEINRSGAILPGRSGYAFYSNSAAEAHAYARAACLRDIGPYAANSLIAEPVVLKVRFSPRTWLQVDFIQPNEPCPDDSLLSIAVLGPVSSANIEAVLNCCHNQRRATVRSFADGSLHQGIKRLKAGAVGFRLDAWALSKLESCARAFNVWLSGKPQVEVTHADRLHRLTHAAFR